jgi:hypothetical protein
VDLIAAGSLDHVRDREAIDASRRKNFDAARGLADIPAILAAPL